MPGPRIQLNDTEGVNDLLIAGRFDEITIELLRERGYVPVPAIHKVATLMDEHGNLLVASTSQVPIMMFKN